MSFQPELRGLLRVGKGAGFSERGPERGGPGGAGVCGTCHIMPLCHAIRIRMHASQECGFVVGGGYFADA